MADVIYPAAPQPFTFRTLQLQGRLVGYSGRTPRRSVTHEFPKRDGAREEDMGRGPRAIDVRLAFVGQNAAKDFAAFEAAVHENPSGLLNHPTAGKWFAFCRGPQHGVDFSRSINGIEVTVTFTESELDATVQADTPDVATAQQNATAQQLAFQGSVADFMGLLAKAQTFQGAALAAIDAGLAQVALINAPVDFMRGVIASASGISSAVVGAVTGIATASDLLAQDVLNFVAGAGDLFDGTDASAGLADQVATLLGVVLADATALEATLIAASPSPAGAADAVAAVEILLDACLTVSDALQAAIPPTIVYVVPAQTNLIVLAQKIIADAGSRMDAATYASAVMGLNRIPNPAAIPAGTKLFVPSLA